MTFAARHYVPVLKAKRAEKDALRLLAAPVRAATVPLLEIVEYTGREKKKGRTKTLAEHIDTAFDGLAESTKGFSRVFIDARELAPEGAAVAEGAFLRAQSEGIRFAPVTGLNRAADIDAALAYRSAGVALRLLREEFEGGDLASKITAFMKDHKLDPKLVDLIVDLGPAEQMVSHGISALTASFLNEVPDPTSWRTLTVSASAFPRSMRILESNSYDSVERAEWVAWREGLHAKRKRIPRLPTYSDCAIQHPSGVEGFDPRIMSACAAIRYLHGDEWLLIKGISTKKRGTKLQFPELASRLTTGDLSARFYKESHCAGCAGMKAASEGVGGFGSAEAWRRLGTIHHITKVVEDLAAMA